MFHRFLVLDSETGALVDSFETDDPPLVVTPAYGKVIVGELARADADVQRIVAYDWIAWEGE